jgi:hypothetical protein
MPPGETALQPPSREVTRAPTACSAEPTTPASRVCEWADAFRRDREAAVAVRATAVSLPFRIVWAFSLQFVGNVCDVRRYQVLDSSRESKSLISDWPLRDAPARRLRSGWTAKTRRR